MKTLPKSAVAALSVFLPLMADAQAPDFNQPQDFSVKPGVRSILQIDFSGGFGSASGGSNRNQLYIGETGDLSNPIDGARSSGGANIFVDIPPLTETTKYWLRLCNDFGCTDTRTITVTVEGADDPGPFANAIELGEGWVSDWLGTFNTNELPWIFHSEHAWMFIWEESTADNLFAFDLSSDQWFYTDMSNYPNLYSFGRNSWVFYFDATSAPRQFVDLQTGEFFSLE